MKFDAIPVSEESAVLMSEIEKTPHLTLGEMIRFVEDEVYALVGDTSNVPPTTLVDCVFELLRSGGSKVLLRRLGHQFQTTPPVDSPYVSVTWSKTETLLVIVQTFDPRGHRRLES